MPAEHAVDTIWVQAIRKLLLPAAHDVGQRVTSVLRYIAVVCVRVAVSVCVSVVT